MKKTRFTESQIVNILKEYEADKQNKDIARKYGISLPIFIIRSKNTMA